MTKPLWAEAKTLLSFYSTRVSKKACRAISRTRSHLHRSGVTQWVISQRNKGPFLCSKRRRHHPNRGYCADVSSGGSVGFYVTFWGVRGSIPTPGHATQRYGGNTACIEVRVDDTLFILDGGSGLRPMGAAMAARGEMAVHAHMFFSHSHWDHIQGFPFFTPAYCPDTILRVYGTAEGDRGIFDLLNGQMQDKYFPVQFSDLGAQVIPDDLAGGGRQIGKAIVDYLDTCHPGGSLAFSVSAYNRKVVYSTDNELDLVLLNREESLADPSAQRKIS